MKAVICTKYGSPDVLEIKEVAKPVPKGNELLVKIHASTVGPSDVVGIKGEPFIVRFFGGFFKPKIPIPLEEIAEAHRYVDKGHKKGDVVITVAHNNET